MWYYQDCIRYKRDLPEETHVYDDIKMEDKPSGQVDDSPVKKNTNCKKNDRARLLRLTALFLLSSFVVIIITGLVTYFVLKEKYGFYE